MQLDTVPETLWQRVHKSPRWLRLSAAGFGFCGLGVAGFIVGLIMVGISTNLESWQANIGVVLSLLSSIAFVFGLILFGLAAWSAAASKISARWPRPARMAERTIQTASIAPRGTHPGILTIDQRRFILQQQIAQLIRTGYRVISQTDTTAQLVRPKRFSCLWATFWLLMLFMGVIVYLFYYAAKRDETIYLEVNEYGRVIRR